MEVVYGMWIGLFLFWFGLFCAYLNKDEWEDIIKPLGIILLLTGILMLGIWIGQR